MIDGEYNTLDASIIQMGRDFSYEVIEKYELGAGPVHVAWGIQAQIRIIA